MRPIIFCTLPFLCCVAGYFIMAQMMDVTNVATPDVVGCSLAEALVRLSDMQLYGHIITEQEDQHIAEGTVIEQMPRASCCMKSRQSVGLIIVRKPKKPIAFYALGKSAVDVEQEAESAGIRIKLHEIALEGNVGTCYAQYPRVGQEIVDRAMHVYIGKPLPSWCIMPHFLGLSLAEAGAILTPLSIKFRVFRDPPLEEDGSDPSLWVVKDQKPAPGEVIDRKMIQAVYLQVTRKT